MHLAADMVLPFKGENGARSKCRVRIYEPREPESDPDRDALVVVVTELSDNPGQSVTNAASVIAAEVISLFRLQRPGRPNPVFVEHCEDGSRGTADDPQTFDLLTFSDYTVRETTQGGAPLRTLGAPTWSPLDRATAERIVGGEL